MTGCTFAVIALISILTSLVTCIVEATQCYACGGDRSGGGRLCREEPWNISSGVITCTSNCSIVRQDSVVPEQLHYITRGCDDGNTTAGCRSEKNMRTCVTICGEDHCNHGTGIPKQLPTTTTTATTTTTMRTTPTRSTTTITLPPGASICWSCSISGAGNDMTCFTDPEKVVTANKLVCKLPRQCYEMVYWSERHGRITSFARGCLVVAEPFNKCVPDSYGTTCKTYCRGHYCNAGDGVPAGTRPPWKKGPAETSGGRCIAPSLFLICLIFPFGVNGFNKWIM